VLEEVRAVVYNISFPRPDKSTDLNGALRDTATLRVKPRFRPEWNSAITLLILAPFSTDLFDGSAHLLAGGEAMAAM
jgi:hypothetical protein